MDLAFLARSLDWQCSYKSICMGVQYPCQKQLQLLSIYNCQYQLQDKHLRVVKCSKLVLGILDLSRLKVLDVKFTSLLPFTYSCCLVVLLPSCTCL